MMPLETERRIAIADLHRRVLAILIEAGVDGNHADILAGVITAAERDGARGHGLLRLPGYLASVRTGWIDGRAVPKITEVGPAFLSIDAGNGFATAALAAARPLLISNAREYGIALLAIRNSHHLGALWPDVEPLAEAGLVALSTVNARSRILVWGAGRKVLGTNPMCFAFPRRDGPPIVWDQASSAASQGEVLLAARRNEKLAPGIGNDSAGRPATDPAKVLDGGTLNPFGGHKGASIALMVEVLAAGLTGGRFGFEDRSARYPGVISGNAGQCVIAIDATRSNEAFGSRIEILLSELRASGVSRFPGEQRYRQRAHSEAMGIALGPEEWTIIERTS